MTINLIKCCPLILGAIFFLASGHGVMANPSSLAAQQSSVVQRLPQLGDEVSMTPQAERLLGNQITKSLYKSDQYIDDPIIQSYVDGILAKLIDASTELGNIPPEMKQAYAWRILLLRDRSINAFALPGAYFGLNLGLIATTDDSSELASVLAHELSHVTQRHIARMISRQKTITPLMIGSMLAGILAASSNPQAATAVLAGGQALGIQTNLNFSRDMEKEADRIGFQVLSKAGYDPRGFVDMFKKLQQASKLNDSNDYPYLRDHPLTTARIADMQNRLGITDLSEKSGDSQPLPDALYAMIRNRAKILIDPDVNPANWVDTIQSKLFNAKPFALQVGDLYGAALAESRTRHFDKALNIVKTLELKTEKESPDVLRVVQLLKAEILLAQGKPQAALDTFAPDHNQLSHRSSQILWAQAANAKGGATLLNQAAQSMQMLTSKNPHDALAWQTLGLIYSQQNHILASMRAQAEEQVAHLDFNQALERFEAGKQWAKEHPLDKSTTDMIQLDIINSKIATMKERIKAQESAPN